MLQSIGMTGKQLKTMLVWGRHLLCVSRCAGIPCIEHCRRAGVCRCLKQHVLVLYLSVYRGTDIVYHAYLSSIRRRLAAIRL